MSPESAQRTVERTRWLSNMSPSLTFVTSAGSIAKGGLQTLAARSLKFFSRKMQCLDYRSLAVGLFLALCDSTDQAGVATPCDLLTCLSGTLEYRVERRLGWQISPSRPLVNMDLAP